MWRGGYHQCYERIPSVLRGDTISITEGIPSALWRDTITTVENVQYCGGNDLYCGGYTICTVEDIQFCGGKPQTAAISLPNC